MFHAFLHSGEFLLGESSEWKHSGTAEIGNAARLVVMPGTRIVVNTGSTLTTTGVLENRGRFHVRLQPPAVFTITGVGGIFLNHGTFMMDSVPPSTLILSGEVSNKGSVTVAEGNTIQFANNGKYTDLDQGNLAVERGIALVTGAECVTNLTSERASISITSGSLVLTSSDPSGTVEISTGVLFVENLEQTLVYGHVIMRGGTINLGGDLELANFTMEGGTVSGPRSLAIQNEWRWVGGHVSPSPEGNVLVQGRLQLESSSLKMLGKHLILRGDSTWIGTNLVLMIQRRFTIASGVKLRVFVSSIVFGSVEGVIENNGQLNITLLNGYCAIHVSLHNFGELLVDGGAAIFGQHMLNEGTLSVGNYSEMVIINSMQSLTGANLQTKNGTVKVINRE